MHILIIINFIYCRQSLQVFSEFNKVSLLKNVNKLGTALFWEQLAQLLSQFLTATNWAH